MSQGSTSIYQKVSIEPAAGSGGGGGSGPFTGITGTPNEIAYFDSAGNGTSDSQATRDDGVVKLTNIASNQYANFIVNDGVSSESLVQADNIGAFGNVGPFIFNGTDDVDTVVAAWNAANPSDTASVISGGTVIPTAQSINLAGGGVNGFRSGLNTFLGATLPTAAMYSSDPTNGADSIIFSGNLTELFGQNSLGAVVGYSDAANFVAAGIFQKTNVFILATDNATYSTRISLDNEAATIQNGNKGFSIDSVDAAFIFGDNAQEYWLPFGLPLPSVGESLAVTGVAGSIVTLGFAPSSGSSPGGSDTEVQFNDGGTFGGDPSFIWDKTKLSFTAGDPLGNDRNVLISVNNLSNQAVLRAPEGDVLLGDPSNINTGTSLQVRAGVNSTILQGYTNVPGILASINTSGVTGLDDIAVVGNWFRTNTTSYTVTCVLNNYKAIRITNPTQTFNPGDTIQNDANIAETALIFAVEPFNGDFWLICDQSLGPWGTTPASVTITAGINVGANANVISFYDDNDIYSVSSTPVNYSYWPMEQGLSINGATIGWNSFTGHTVSDVWVITFTANYLPGLDFNWDNSTFNIGVHTTTPQSISPKGIRIEYNPTGTIPGTLKIGRVQENQEMLVLGSNSSGGLLYLNGATTSRYLDIQPGVLYEFGDLDTSVTGDRYVINSTTNAHTFYTSGDFDVYYASAGRVMHIDAQTFFAEIGDIDGGGNGSRIEISDAAQRITLDSLKTKITLAAYDDDTAAGVGGLVAGEMYQTTGAGAAPLNAAGIVMVKQ
jgi:hypothetical protein